VSDESRGNEFDAFVTIEAPVEIVEEALTSSEQDGDDCDVHLVDQAGA
jgi:hypothetical protein